MAPWLIRLSVPERVKFKLFVLAYRCLHGLRPDYFSSDFTRVSDLRPRQRLSSASTAALVAPATRRFTLGDRQPGFSRHSRQVVELTAIDITTTTSLVIFRHQLETFLLRRS